MTDLPKRKWSTTSPLFHDECFQHLINKHPDLIFTEITIVKPLSMIQQIKNRQIIGRNINCCIKCAFLHNMYFTEYPQYTESSLPQWTIKPLLPMYEPSLPLLGKNPLLPMWHNKSK